MAIRVGNQRVWPHRPQRPEGHRRVRPQGYRRDRHQRPRTGRDNAHLLRFDSVHGRFPGTVTVDGRFNQPRQRQDQGFRRARSVQAAVEGTRRRHRAGMHRHLHRQGQGLRAPDRRGQARAGFGAGRPCRRHHRLWRQSRQAEQGSSGSSPTAPAPPTALRRSRKC